MRSSILTFDLTGDGRVDRLDMDAWRTIAGAENLISGAPYEQSDANLDGMVNLTDFLLWRVVKFSVTGGWSRGDFNADGVTDVSDFNIWNDHYTPSLASQVPEPTGALLVILGVSLAVSRLAECRRNHGIKAERTKSRLS